MKGKLAIIFILFCFLGCKDNLYDKSKRNENWIWWVDAKTGKAGWIPVNNGSPVKNGKYTRFYYNGNVYSKGTLINGVDADTIRYYDLKGQLQEYNIEIKNNSIDYYKNNGPIKTYYTNGQILAIGTVQNHHIGDQWKRFYKNGNSDFVRKLKSDTGWITLYYENGKVKDSDYQEGANLFNIKHWYDNGQLEHSNEFKDHNKNGKHLQYYENGQLQATGNDLNGERQGEEKQWYENGKLFGISHRSHGILNGKSVLYFENGKIKGEINYINGKAEGEGRKFDENGKLIIDRIFKDGVMVDDKLNPVSGFNPLVH